MRLACSIEDLRMGKLALGAFLFAWLATALAAAAEPVLRFGPWRGACAPGCEFATPVEFGARLFVRPAADGGLAVTLSPLDPAPGTPLRFDFATDAPPITVPASRWRSDAGARVTLTDAYDRAVVLEWLPAAATTTVRWTARTGEPRAAEIPTAEAAAALGWLTETTGHRVRVVDPEAPRYAWADDPRAFMAAVQACHRDGGQEVVRVVGAVRWTESADAVAVLDAEGGLRRCVVRRGDGVVIGWEPLDDRGPRVAGPVLTLPPAGPCFGHAALRDADGALVGLLCEHR